MLAALGSHCTNLNCVSEVTTASGPQKIHPLLLAERGYQASPSHRFLPSPRLTARDTERSLRIAEKQTRAQVTGKVSQQAGEVTETACSCVSLTHLRVSCRGEQNSLSWGVEPRSGFGVKIFRKLCSRHDLTFRCLNFKLKVDLKPGDKLVLQSALPWGRPFSRTASTWRRHTQHGPTVASFSVNELNKFS